MHYEINFTWDSDAAVWLATSEEVKGLVLESGSLDALIERVRYAVPELLSLNHDKISETIEICFKLERNDRVYA